MGGGQSKSIASKTSRATRGERGTAGSDSSAMDKTPASSNMKGEDKDDDKEDGIVGEGLLGEGRFLEVPRRAHNVCGIFEDTYLIVEPFDDQMERDLAIYSIFNSQQPWAPPVVAYIARPEATRRDAKESFDAFLQVSRAHDAKEGKNGLKFPHIPKCVLKGKLKRLVFGIEEFQQYEHDPDWINRPAILYTMPAGVFVSSLLANAPLGIVEPWLALNVGIGLVQALNSLHKLGFIHRYVTPWNFLLKTPFTIEGLRDDVMHVDFSLAVKWPSRQNKQNDLVGTRKYSSKRALSRHVQGPADDFISVIYIVAELISGKLPWRAAKTVAVSAQLRGTFPHHVVFTRLPREIRLLYHFNSNTENFFVQIIQMQSTIIVALFIFISCSTSLVLQCLSGKKSGSKKEAAGKKKATKEGRKKSGRKRESNQKSPTREEKKKSGPNKKYIKSKSFDQKEQKPNKWYQLQIQTTELPSSKSPVKEQQKFETAKADETRRNETQQTAKSLGGRVPTVEKATSDGNAVNLVVGEAIGNYKVTSRLGAGGCGVVYRVVSKEGKDYAMKVERTNIDRSDQLLPLEAHILKRLQVSPYAAQFQQFGRCEAKEGGFRVLIMGLLGPSLSELQKQQLNGRFSIGTILKIGIQAVRAVAFMHSTYFVHRDIKPGNFAIDEGNHRRLYLFDFGLARSIKTRGEMSLRRPRPDVPFRGTPAYCSLNAHKRNEHGRHDDLWSIFYMLVELAIARLPWQGKNRIQTTTLKEHLMDSHYMLGCPVAFSTILIYLRSLDYYKRPDYVGIEHAFFEMLRARRLSWGMQMEWENQRPKQYMGVSVPDTSDSGG
uniref:Protein kinase domain-containing protein n=1 Tax=Meloidogyne javanica TaxID=6303 RepID=A0A915LTP8_MELJA